MLLLLLFACASQPQESSGTREARCDGLDDDADGLVDEGVLIVQPELSTSTHLERSFPTLRFEPQDALQIQPGVATVYGTKRPYPAIEGLEPKLREWERRYDSQGREIHWWDLNWHGDWDEERTETLQQAAWGPYGRTWWRSETTSEDLETGQTQTDLWWDVTLEYNDLGQLAGVHGEQHGLPFDAVFEYDAQGRQTLVTETGDGSCSQTRTEWDDSAFTRTRLFDRDCGGTWADQGTVYYDTNWQPTGTDPDSPSLTWAGTDLVVQGDGADRVEYEHQGGLLTQSVTYEQGERTAWASMEYTAGGLPLLWTASEGSSQKSTRFGYNAAGGLSQVVSSHLDDSESWRSEYLSDSQHNIERIERQFGDSWIEYSFDCHPPQ
ncbi:MAG: hypothetical protein VX899_07345 [Myxococcota bacterium]|nr:hypothetical protein [Myxococcota bacterium]